MDPLPTSPNSLSNPAAARKLWLLALLAGVCGFAARLWFIRGSVVANPNLADSSLYCNYAWNLLHFHTFSMVDPGSDSVPPDSYRDPGYPLLLAALMWPFGSGNAWYQAVLTAQALLGGLSATLTVFVTSRWLGPAWSFAAGLLLAVWPHNVAISAYLLSESLFCFMILSALGLLLLAEKSTRAAHWGIAGLGFGAAAMVNATLTPFGLLLGAMLWLRKALPRHCIAALVAGSLLLPVAWGARGLGVPLDDSAGGRAMANLVQGSWPEYHAVFVRSASGDQPSNKVLAEIYAEIDLAWHSPAAWLGVAKNRIAANPGRYIAWYAWKPALLWAWNIRVGVGDVYVSPILHPIFMTYAPLSLFESLCVGINPLLFVLMLGTVCIVLCKPAAVAPPVALYAAALLVAAETLVYSVLQSEPRYSIPLRPLEMILAATACNWLWRCWRRYVEKGAPPAPVKPVANGKTGGSGPG